MRRGSLFDPATAILAFAAAVFWWLSAARTFPPMLSYWDSVPASDPYRLAVESSAWFNTYAAFLSGCSALGAFASWLVKRRA
jgi:hypothetical protein